MSLLPDLKAVENDKTCSLPEASASAPQDIDPTKENEVLFTYSVHWEVSDLKQESDHCVTLNRLV